MDARDETGRDGAGNGRRTDRFGSLAWLSEEDRHLSPIEADESAGLDGVADAADDTAGELAEPALHGEIAETGPLSGAFDADARAGPVGTTPAAVGDGLAVPLSAAGQLEGTGVLDGDDSDFRGFTVPDDLSTLSFLGTGIAGTGIASAAAVAADATTFDPDLDRLDDGPAAYVELPPTFPMASEPVTTIAAGLSTATGLVTGPGPVTAASADGWRSPRPLPPTVDEKRRRWPKVLALLLPLAAIAGIVAVLATRTDDGAVSSGGGSTSATTVTASTTAQPDTTVAGAAAAVSTTATTTAPTTAATSATSVAPPTTAATPAPATTGVGAPTGPATAADDAVDLFTPVRWAIFDNGKVQLLGRVPNQQAADTIAAKAAAVVGKDNVQAGYTIDPNAPLPPSAPLYVKDLVLFDPGSAALKPASYPLLDLGVVLLQQNPGVRIRVIGRADNRGDPNKNLLLSLDRAQSVVDYVASKGIDPTRLTPVPLGVEAAVGDNATPDGQAQNRSVAFVITGLLA